MKSFFFKCMTFFDNNDTFCIGYPINQAITQSIHRSVNQSVTQSENISADWLTDRSIARSIDQSVNQSVSQSHYLQSVPVVIQDYDAEDWPIFKYEIISSNLMYWIQTEKNMNENVLLGDFIFKSWPNLIVMTKTTFEMLLKR